VYNTPRKEDGLKKKKFKGFFFFFFTFFPYAQRILRRQLNSWSLFSRLSGLVYIHTHKYIQGKALSSSFYFRKKDQPRRGGCRVASRTQKKNKNLPRNKTPPASI
jgi:hypothetical protein